MFRVVKTVELECAHSLPDGVFSTPCTRNHGHTYKVEVCVKGVLLDEFGMLVDFGHIGKVLEKYDHQCLNELMVGPTTAECFAAYLALEIQQVLDALTKRDREVRVDYVTVRETSSGVVTFSPDEL